MAHKIKKEAPTKPNNQDLMKFIIDDKKQREKNKEKKLQSMKADRKKPSEYPFFKRWRKKEFEKWDSYDCTGYYLFRYNEIIGTEDIDFINKKSCTTSSFYKEVAHIQCCFKSFFSDYEDFKNFIDFMLNWWISADSFVDGLPSFWSIFTNNKTTFIKKYNAEKLKLKKKQSANRKENDNKMASKSAWDNYFDKKGD